MTCPSTVLAVSWEELYRSKSGEIEAKVEMKKYSFKKRLITGEKIITAELRMFYRQGEITSQATGDYEIHCAARKAFRSDFEMEVEGPDSTQSTIRTPNKTMLQGEECQDFIGLMEILCGR